MTREANVSMSELFPTEVCPLPLNTRVLFIKTIIIVGSWILMDFMSVNFSKVVHRHWRMLLNLMGSQ